LGFPTFFQNFVACGSQTLRLRKAFDQLPW